MHQTSGNIHLKRDMFNTEIWQERQDLGNGVKKLLSGAGAQQKLAYFKALSRRQGPSGANEYLVFQLAQLLHLPVAEIQLIRFNAVDGLLSMEIVNSNPWQVFPAKDTARDYLEDPTVVARILAFDMWVRNKDRHDRNLVFQQSATTAGRYQLYMIDNEHCLYGFQGEPPNPLDDYNDVVKIPELTRAILDRDELMQAVSSIQALDDRTITDMVDNFARAAPAYLNDGQAVIIKNLLLARKAQLADRVGQWYDAQMKA